MGRVLGGSGFLIPGGTGGHSKILGWVGPPTLMYDCTGRYVSVFACSGRRLGPLDRLDRLLGGVRAGSPVQGQALRQSRPCGGWERVPGWGPRGAEELQRLSVPRYIQNRHTVLGHDFFLIITYRGRDFNLNCRLTWPCRPYILYFFL